MTDKVFNKKNTIICVFWGIAIFKIVCMSCFSSDYQDALFYPFARQYLDGIERSLAGQGASGFYSWRNPYEYYYTNQMVAAFPYPPLMLYLESFFVFLIRLFSIKNWFLFHFILKLPIFLFDNLITVILWKLFPDKPMYIVLLYYASPIIIYSGYMHGQLDIVPTAILLAAIYFLLEGRGKYRFLVPILLAAAVLTKQHTAAVIPVLYLYNLKREGFKKSFYFLVAMIVIVIAGVAPFWSEGFIRCVLLNKEQKSIMNVYVDYDSLKFIIPVFMILTLYLKAFYLVRINRELLLNYCGIVFAVFLAFVAPMPGWYTWIVPFITIFFINSGQDKYKNLLLYLALNGSYLIYFLFFHNKGMTDLYFCGLSLSYIKFENSILRNQIFTVMTGILIYTIYQMYHLGITSNSLYKRGNIPFSIGISGDSGSGKSHMLYTIKTLFGEKNVLEIEGDGDHKWKRGEETWKFYTHLDPKANYLYRQANDIQMLKQGKSVYRVDYNHETGIFSAPHKIRPRKIIIICGLHSLYLPQMRKCLDIKIYMDTQENLRKFWKTQRDIQKRGYSGEGIATQIACRVQDSQKYILPQKKYADMVIRFYDANIEQGLPSESYTPEISLKITLGSEVDLESIIADIRDAGIITHHDFEKDLDKQTVTFDGASLRVSSLRWQDIARKNIPQLEELTVQNTEMDSIGSIVSLFVLAEMSSKLRQGV